MKIKVKSSSSFRRDVPGVLLGTVKKLAKFEGQLYTFQYTSKGPSKTKTSRNIDRYPLLLLATKDGKKMWKANNGKSYIYGFNLNYLPPSKRLRVIKLMPEILSEGVMYSYYDLRDKLRLPTGTRTTIFRKYDVRGSKLRVLREVNLDTYESYLEESIA